MAEERSPLEEQEFWRRVLWNDAKKRAELRSSDDLLLWPDGTWCEARDLDQYGHMSDDFERIPTGSVRAASLRGEFS